MSELHLLKHTWVRDILAYEGPLLALLQDDEGKKFLYYWNGVHEDKNRWLAFEVSDVDLQLYFDQKVTLLDLLQLQSHAFLVDIGWTDRLIHGARKLLVSELPKEMTPPEESFYDPDLDPGA